MLAYMSELINSYSCIKRHACELANSSSSYDFSGILCSLELIMKAIILVASSLIFTIEPICLHTDHSCHKVASCIHDVAYIASSSVTNNVDLYVIYMYVSSEFEIIYPICCQHNMSRYCLGTPHHS